MLLEMQCCYRLLAPRELHVILLDLVFACMCIITCACIHVSRAAAIYRDMRYIAIFFVYRDMRYIAIFFIYRDMRYIAIFFLVISRYKRTWIYGYRRTKDGNIRTVIQQMQLAIVSAHTFEFSCGAAYIYIYIIIYIYIP